MALGSTYQSNNPNNRMYEPNYYSRIRIKNPTDNLMLNFSFWSGTLKVSITEAGNAQDGRNNEIISIYLSPTKARIFADQVKKIIDDPETPDIFGVNTGSGEVSGLIAIARDMGRPYLFIGKIGSDGKYISSQRFNFNYNYNYALKINDLISCKVVKDYDNCVELVQLKDILDEFAKFANGAAGAMIFDINRYEAAKTSNTIRKIAEKIGVPMDRNGSNYQGGGRNSYFDNLNSQDGEPSSNANTSKRSSYQSVEDLEDELG